MSHEHTEIHLGCERIRSRKGRHFTNKLEILRITGKSETVRSQIRLTNLLQMTKLL